MLAIHGAVQIQIDRIGLLLHCSRNDLPGNALEGIAGDVGGRRGARPQYRYQFGTLFHGADETADRDIDVPHLQHVGAAGQGGKGPAPHKIFVGGGRRRETVGFVLKSCNQNAQSPLSTEIRPASLVAKLPSFR